MTLLRILGKNLMLHSQRAGRKVNDLVISCHGGFHQHRHFPGRKLAIAFGGMTQVPEMATLIFYGPHGMLLQDPMLINLMLGKLTHLEKIPSNALIQNYTLSSFQSETRGETEETFDTIAQDLTINRTFMHMSRGSNPDTSSVLAANCGSHLKSYDVLTIQKASSPKLSDILDQIRGGNLCYRNIHCLFCRGIFGQPAQTHDSQNN